MKTARSFVAYTKPRPREVAAPEFLSTNPPRPDETLLVDIMEAIGAEESTPWWLAEPYLSREALSSYSKFKESKNERI